MKEHNDVTDDEQTIHRLLESVGAREDIPPQLKASLTDIARVELQGIIRRRRRRAASLAACASIFLLAIVWLAPFNQSADAIKVASVTRLSGGAVIEKIFGSEALQPHAVIFEDAVLETTRGGYLSLDYGQTDLRLNESTRVQIKSDRIILLSGEIYAQNNSTTGALFSSTKDTKSVLITTPLGDVRDIGTQFTVSYIDKQLETIVREGKIELSLDGEKHLAIAGEQHAQAILVANNKKVVSAQRKKSGKGWDWILYLTPAFAPEGKSVDALLKWSSKETGLQLVYASDIAQTAAEATLLHGDLPVKDPLFAVDAALASTNLKARKANSSLLVSVARQN